MYAVIETGGKQYQVAQGDLFNVEKLEAQIGDKVIFDNVLLLKEEGQAAKIGQPTVAKTVVEAEVIDQNKHKKIFVFTFKRRKGYRKQQGHRQPFTCLKVLRIGTDK